ncbi:hypothetical protein NM688_g5 [Phlebia brevispora]|uniref:Uncharacterized protein n=1 Tax=Phlebia brevispora TaxID=194682 RepID=A0ACC1TFM8_9APHY|nr:hypothetical protein NM688_g5 [Phlebia brevispora]
MAQTPDSDKGQAEKRGKEVEMSISSSDEEDLSCAQPKVASTQDQAQAAVDSEKLGQSSASGNQEQIRSVSYLITLAADHNNDRLICSAEPSLTVDLSAALNFSEHSSGTPKTIRPLFEALARASAICESDNLKYTPDSDDEDDNPQNTCNASHEAEQGSLTPPDPLAVFIIIDSIPPTPLTEDFEFDTISEGDLDDAPGIQAPSTNDTTPTLINHVLSQHLIPGNGLHHELANEINHLSALGVRDNHPMRPGERSVSPATHTSQLGILSPPHDFGMPIRTVVSMWNSETLCHINKHLFDVRPDATLPYRPFRTRETEGSGEAEDTTRAAATPSQAVPDRLNLGLRAQEPVPDDVSVNPAVLSADNNHQDTVPDKQLPSYPAHIPLTVIIPELLKTGLHHPPEVLYHAVYRVVHPPMPTMQHIQFRNIMILAYRHISLQARILNFDPWIEDLHHELHMEPTPFNCDLHDKIFLLTSEWAGNPFLFLIEEGILRQCYEFYTTLATC